MNWFASNWFASNWWESNWWEGEAEAQASGFGVGLFDELDEEDMFLLLLAAAEDIC